MCLCAGEARTSILQRVRLSIHACGNDAVPLCLAIFAEQNPSPCYLCTYLPWLPTGTAAADGIALLCASLTYLLNMANGCPRTVCFNSAVSVRGSAGPSAGISERAKLCP